jgi:predicted nucleotidyltransferase component of viral defense system
LFRYTKVEMARIAQRKNFIRDTLEKVLRLTDILVYLNENPLTKGSLALKGGTAINLTIFDLPRLSVDIDLDFCEESNREEMLEKRKQINADIRSFLEPQGYAFSERSRSKHSLDSMVFDYTNLGGRNDHIKIETNYSLRSHLFTPEHRKVLSDLLPSGQEVLCLAPMEIYAGKINALLSRTAVRDLYDVYQMIRRNLFLESELPLLRKSVVFYTAVSQKSVWQEYSTLKIDRIDRRKIKTDLTPVLRSGDPIELDEMKDRTKAFLWKLMTLDDDEKRFLKHFSMKEFRPELLFSDPAILSRIDRHPMILWKMQHEKD